MIKGTTMSFVLSSSNILMSKLKLCRLNSLNSNMARMIESLEYQFMFLFMLLNSFLSFFSVVSFYYVYAYVSILFVYLSRKMGGESIGFLVIILATLWCFLILIKTIALHSDTPCFCCTKH